MVIYATFQLFGSKNFSKRKGGVGGHHKERQLNVKNPQNLLRPASLGKKDEDEFNFLFGVSP